MEINKKQLEQYRKWKESGQTPESKEQEKWTYLIEVTYKDTHNSEVVTITTSDVNWSMNEYQRNRKPLEYEIIDWKRERDSRMLQDERDTE